METERLSLRPIEPGDAEELHALWTQEAVREFLWDGEAIPIASTREIAAQNQALFEERGLGIWGVRERGSDELVGFAGYWHFRTPPVLELLFGVAHGHWNRGLATESARRVIEHGFEELGMRRIDASTDVANAASVRVLERLGMTLDGREVVDGLDTVFFVLSPTDRGASES